MRARLGIAAAVTLILTVAAARAEITVETIEYGGWQRCVRVTNGVVEAVATTEVGPRIIRFGYLGKPNEFWENPDDAGQRGGDVWRIYGGHRLWHAPETRPRTYLPDNTPISWEAIPGGVRLTMAADASGLAKVIELTLSEDSARVRVLMRLRNEGTWPIEVAPWSISAMAPGGVGVFPMPVSPADALGLQPNRWLALWTYTDLADPRLTMGKRFLLLRQDPSATEALKIGLNASDGWLAYVRDGRCFVKTHQVTPGARYPDGGCTVESYTNGNPNLLELETLGPLDILEPGASVEHVEHWRLFSDVPSGADERWAEDVVSPLGARAVAGR